VVFSGYSGFLHDITNILLNVALNTYPPPPNCLSLIDGDYVCVDDVDRNFHQVFSKIRDDSDYVCVDDVDRNFHQIFSKIRDDGDYVCVDDVDHL
jgi:hypothetical protein